MSEEASRIKKRMKAGAQRQASSPSTPSPSNSLDVPGSPRRTESPEQLEPYEGIWDLHGERPPPSSIAARKDTVRLWSHFLSLCCSQVDYLQREARKLVGPLSFHAPLSFADLWFWFFLTRRMFWMNITPAYTLFIYGQIFRMSRGRSARRRRARMRLWRARQGPRFS